MIKQTNVEDLKQLSGAILLVKVPEKKVGKEPVFTGRGLQVPTNKAEHVLTQKLWGMEKGDDKDRLGVRSIDSFSGYLSSTYPQALHPSFEGKDLQQILDYYIENNNDVMNKKDGARSNILQVGYSPKEKYGVLNSCLDTLFTDSEYTQGQEYLTLEEYVELGKPKIMKKTSKVTLEKVE